MEERRNGSETCTGCQVEINDGDLVVRDHGESYHASCIPRPARIGLRDEPAAVRCSICRAGIATIAEMAITDSGPTHVGCRRARPDFDHRPPARLDGPDG
jgi:hypothetical protein